MKTVLNIARATFLFLAVSLAGAQGPQHQLRVYPSVDVFARSADFTLQVRNPGRSWTEVPVYAVPVSTGFNLSAAIGAEAKPVDVQKPSVPRPANRELTSMASFDFLGEVEVRIACKRGAAKNVRVRPTSYGITPRVSGDTVLLSLREPRNLSVEIDGDLFHNLQLFANPIEETRPSPSDSHVIYYGPGVHEVGDVEVPSGKTVYLAGGAVVLGNFHLSHVHDVRILGRGILAHPATTLRPDLQLPRLGGRDRRDSILVEYSHNVLVDGPTFVPSSYTVLIGQSEDITVQNIKSFSAGGWNDGIDVFTSKHVLIQNVFMRNADDCIAIYGHRWNYSGDVTDVVVRNSTLWADVAHPILVGTHGNTAHPETLSQLKFQNIDILDQREPQIDYQGCMSLNAGDSNLIRDVLFEDIRVEDIRLGQLFNLRVTFNRKYNTSPGRGIENVLFRNVSYNGHRATLSILAGYDEQRALRNLTFENLRINGVLIADDMPGKPGFYKTGDAANIFIGEHVEGVAFRRTSRPAEK